MNVISGVSELIDSINALEYASDIHSSAVVQSDVVYVVRSIGKFVDSIDTLEDSL